MRIWIIEIGEPLPMEPQARLLRHGLFSRELARRGHEVIWWTSSFSHSSMRQLYDCDQEIVICGVALRIIHGPGYTSNVSLARLIHQNHFARRFAREAPKHRAPELVLCTIPTVESAFVVQRYCSAHGVPFIIDFRDQWPDELVSVVPVGLQTIARAMLRPHYSKATTACKKASAICAVSQNFLDYGLAFANRKQSQLDFVFPLGYQKNSSVSRAEVEEAKFHWRQIGLRENVITCCFFGRIGRFFNLDTLIDYARLKGDRSDAQFVLCGDGSHLPAIKKRAQGLHNVFLPGWVSEPQIQSLMEISDIAIAPYNADAKMEMPNKIFEYFSGGLPIVSSLTGEARRILADQRCGFSYAADSLESFSKALEKLVANPNLRETMGENAQRLFKSKYSTDIVFPDAIHRLKTILGHDQASRKH